MGGAVQGFKDDDTVIRWRDCPDCEGRGWFLINPFATGGGNGVGGVGNACQCQSCKKEYERQVALGLVTKN